MTHRANETAGATSTSGGSNVDVDVAAVRLVELMQGANFGSPGMSVDDAREIAGILQERLRSKKELPSGHRGSQN